MFEERSSVAERSPSPNLLMPDRLLAIRQEQIDQGIDVRRLHPKCFQADSRERTRALPRGGGKGSAPAP